MENQRLGSEEIILGFDARVAAEEPQAEWPQIRRDEWLIRPDVPFPRSVDSFIWPSVTDYRTSLGQSTWIGFIQDLWEDCGALLSFLQSYPPSRRYQIICIALVREYLSDANESLWSSIVLPTNPSRLSSEWQPVGCDVADRYLTSGIVCLPRTDLGFEELKTSFGKKVNTCHLFDKPEDANQFRHVANRVIIDHAPFFVFRLYAVAHELCGSH